MYWPENADVLFVPAPGCPLTVKYKSVMPFAEFVIRKMVVAHVCETINYFSLSTLFS